MTGFGKANPVEVEGAFKKCSEFHVMHDPFLQWHEFVASSGEVGAFDNADFLAQVLMITSERTQAASCNAIERPVGPPQS